MRYLIGLFFTFSCFAADPGQEISNWEARLEYARILSYRKQYREAMDQYRKLLKENPSSQVAQTEMAQILYYQGNYKDAMQILENIPIETLNEKALLLIGDIALSLKEYPKAESIYRQHLNQSPNDDPVRLKLAELLSWEKKYEESIALYQELLKIHPEDIQLRRKYALALMWMGNDDQAAEELKKTLND